MKKRLRCAIYTRKSTEEGLDQDFNSLDAQREACEAYVRSQAGEGWALAKQAYDDGGYSGGTMNRPALGRLLQDIAGGRIDIVVVYKVDRLTRSLADFARIVEIFDRAGASFVSVTQSFNTTTSMGRLTLNVLLSFAQFEREVTGERIRDKFAASKAKGIWMGGVPPLGYDLGDRALVANEREAALVRRIFTRYLELGAILPLARELEAEGVRTKRWTSRAGREIGGCVMGRGALNHILTSRIYRGEITHKGKIYKGVHEAIIDEVMWDAVQAQLQRNTPSSFGAPQSTNGHLLTGLIYDDAGHLMSPTHATKGAKRYRYYCSGALLHDKRGAPGSVARLPAATTDKVMIDAVVPRLDARWCDGDPTPTRVRTALLRVEAHSSGFVVQLRRDAARTAFDPSSEDNVDEPMTLRIAAAIRKRGGTTIVDADGGFPKQPRVNAALVRAIVMARSWTDQLARGEVKSTREIARRENLCRLYVGKLLPLAFLAPDLVEAVLDGRQPQGVSISALLSEPLPVSWKAQRERFRSLA